MSATLAELTRPLKASPLLADVVDELTRWLAAERARRQRFYQDITPEMKAEFIEGEVVLHSPARNGHLDVTSRLSRLLSLYVDVHRLGEVKIEKCLVVFPRNDYEPDLVFFRADKAAGFAPGTMKFPVPDLIVEVLSDTTEARDRGVKFDDYEAHGVGEYWIVDPEAKTVEQYVLRAGRYELRMKAASGELASEVITGLRFPVKALFDSEANLAAVQRWLGQ